MRKLHEDIEEAGGIATMGWPLWQGNRHDSIVLGARYGLLIMVRKGQYARASESSSGAETQPWHRAGRFIRGRRGAVRCLQGLRRHQVLGVKDGVAVALLGQEALSVLREILIDGVASNESVEVRR